VPAVRLRAAADLAAVLGPQAGVAAARLERRLPLEGAVAVQAPAGQLAALDRRQDGAAGLDEVAAVGEPARGGEPVDLREQGVEVLRAAQPDRAETGGVQDGAAPRCEVELARDGRVPALALRTERPGLHHLRAEKRVEQGRLADAGGPEQGDREPLSEPGAHRLEPVALGSADREHLAACGARQDLAHRGAGVLVQVGLGEQDDRSGAGGPGEREEPFDAAQVQVGDHRLDDGDDIGVRGEHLRVRGP